MPCDKKPRVISSQDSLPQSLQNDSSLGTEKNSPTHRSSQRFGNGDEGSGKGKGGKGVAKVIGKETIYMIYTVQYYITSIYYTIFYVIDISINLKIIA